MSGYIGTQPVAQATQTRDVFTATSGQTTFATSGYTPNFLDVWLNGVKLVNGDDFTATNGSDVVLTTGATAGDTVEVLSYSTYEVNAQTYTGGLTVNNDAATVLTVDRATSDGTLVDIKKNGSTVGAIGTYANEYYYGSPTGGDTFLRHGWNGIVPATSSGTDRDAAIQLGSSVSRFKDLYLSGGVYLGGTGAANLLDDYEEGTWTPTLNGSVSNPTVTYTSANTGGVYVKVGRVVYITYEVRTSAISGGSGDVRIGGLPFARSTTSNPDGDRFTLDLYNVTFPSGSNYVVNNCPKGQTYFSLLAIRSGTSHTDVNISGWPTSSLGIARASGFYYTDA